MSSPVVRAEAALLPIVTLPTALVIAAPELSPITTFAPPPDTNFNVPLPIATFPEALFWLRSPRADFPDSKPI